ILRKFIQHFVQIIFFQFINIRKFCGSNIRSSLITCQCQSTKLINDTLTRHLNTMEISPKKSPDFNTPKSVPSLKDTSTSPLEIKYILSLYLHSTEISSKTRRNSEKIHTQSLHIL